jgi:hypothetical protein
VQIWFSKSSGFKTFASDRRSVHLHVQTKLNWIFSLVDSLFNIKSFLCSVLRPVVVQWNVLLLSLILTINSLFRRLCYFLTWWRVKMKRICQFEEEQFVLWVESVSVCHRQNQVSLHFLMISLYDEKREGLRMIDLQTSICCWIIKIVLSFWEERTLLQTFLTVKPTNTQLISLVAHQMIFFFQYNRKKISNFSGSSHSHFFGIL